MRRKLSLKRSLVSFAGKELLVDGDKRKARRKKNGPQHRFPGPANGFSTCKIRSLWGEGGEVRYNIFLERARHLQAD